MRIFAIIKQLLIQVFFPSIYAKNILETLKNSGLKVGKDVYIMTPGDIDNEFRYLISIGDNSILSEDVIVLGHDASTVPHLGYCKLGKVTIGSRTFIGARTIILPGVNIGNDVIIGAGSVVTHNIPDNSVAVGNPARVIKSTFEYIEKHKKKLPNHSRSLRGEALRTSENKKFIQETLKDGPCYV